MTESLLSTWYAVDVSAEAVLHYDRTVMSIREDVKDWLVGNVGWGEPRWWNRSELEHHFETCHNGVTCDKVTGFRCYGEEDSWGWTPMTAHNDGWYIPIGLMGVVTFLFRRPNDACLFKLRWCGS